MEFTNKKYDAIRPFSDSETVEASRRISESEEFGRLTGALCPEIGTEMLRKAFASVTCVDDLQSRIMLPIVSGILEKTSDGLTCSGLENVKDSRAHLLLSGHRDIILDPGIIEYLFKINDIPWMEIAVGDNLLSSPLVEDLMRSNRMIKVIRSGSNREKYLSSKLLSEYIRDTVTSGRSVWISHRSGRTKDGCDTTGKGVLKMLYMSSPKDFTECFESLNIVPVSVSYEYESCDFLKAKELYLSAEGPYIKSPGEDDESMMQGIRQKKGRIHFHFSQELNHTDLVRCASVEQNGRFTALGDLITASVRAGFHLWPNNYIAFDILNGREEMAAHYTSFQKESFVSYMENGLSKIMERSPKIEYSALKDIYLHIYANPVFYKCKL